MIDLSLNRVDINKNIEENIKKLLDSSGMSNSDLAKLLNVSGGSISNWISGKNRPDLPKLFLICSIFNVSLYDICGLSDELELPNDGGEMSLIRNFRKLNIVGKTRLMDDSRNYSELKRYTL